MRYKQNKAAAATTTTTNTIAVKLNKKCSCFFMWHAIRTRRHAHKHAHIDVLVGLLVIVFQHLAVLCCVYVIFYYVAAFLMPQQALRENMSSFYKRFNRTTLFCSVFVSSLFYLLQNPSLAAPFSSNSSAANSFCESVTWNWIKVAWALLSDFYLLCCKLFNNLSLEVGFNTRPVNMPVAEWADLKGSCWVSSLISCTRQYQWKCR